jgi:SOS response regulatory protein OraA/RecX
VDEKDGQIHRELSLLPNPFGEGPLGLMRPEIHAPLLSALKILKRQDLTIQEVTSRLECNFEPDLVADTVEFLTANRLLDDLRYARNTIERNEGRRAVGDQALRDKLESRGVPDQVITSLMSEVDQDELTRAQVLVSAKFSGAQSPGRIARFLASRGFSDETVESILQSLIFD